MRLTSNIVVVEQWVVGLGFQSCPRVLANGTPFLEAVQRVLVWCQGHSPSRNSQRDLTGALLSKDCHMSWHSTRWLPQLRQLGAEFCRVFYMLVSLCGSCREMPISCMMCPFTLSCRARRRCSHEVAQAAPTGYQQQTPSRNL